MRVITLMALLVFGESVLPGASQENDAKIVFSKMKKRLLGAKTVQCDFTTQIHAKYPTFPSTGVCQLGEKNRVNIKVTGKIVTEWEYRFRSDGNQLKSSLKGRPIDYAAKADDELGKRVRFGMAVTGIGTSVEWLANAEGWEIWHWVGVEDRVRLSEFKMSTSGEEGLDDSGLVAVDYCIEIQKKPGGRDDPRTYFCTVWIDKTKHLPIRRAVRFKGSRFKKSYVMWENYKNVELNNRIDLSTFTLP